MTEDKKAIKKIHQSQNKVRFRLEAEIVQQQDQPSADYSDCGDSDERNNNNNNDNNDEQQVEFKEFRIEQEVSFLNEDADDYQEIGMDAVEKKQRDEPEEENHFLRILKVSLENNTTKTFKYDRTTCVRDVLASLKGKLHLNMIEHFGLCIKPKGENSISKLVFLEENFHLYQIEKIYGTGRQVRRRKTSIAECEDDFDDNEAKSELSTSQIEDQQNYECLFRFLFVPSSYENLLASDQNAFNYLYEQVTIFFKKNF